MNLTELNKSYDRYLYLKYKSNDTICSYKNCLKKFLKENNRVYRFTNLELKEYFIDFGKKYSGSYYNQMLSSLRILYVEILKQKQKLNGIFYKKVKPKTVNIPCTIPLLKIYIPEENLGIRLEDDVIVQANGEPFNLMRNIPIKADEIEDLMQG